MQQNTTMTRKISWKIFVTIIWYHACLHKQQNNKILEFPWISLYQWKLIAIEYGSHIIFSRLSYPWKFQNLIKSTIFSQYQLYRVPMHVFYICPSSKFRKKSGKIRNLYQQFGLIAVIYIVITIPMARGSFSCLLGMVTTLHT